MSTQTTQFAWKDHDTAARDMLQLSYYAPSSIRRHALQLLEAFRSPVILPELKQIVMDDKRDVWERRYALRAISSIPGDIYFPELSRFVSAEDNWLSLSFDDFFGLARNHPSNLQWLFHEIEQLEPKAYLQVLRNATDYFHEGVDLNPILCQRIRDAIDLNPLLLSLDLIDTLYYRDASEANLKWLRERWDTILQLCITSDMDSVIRLIVDWDELRPDIFQKWPSIIDAYEYRQARIATLELERQNPPAYLSSPLWLELNGLYQSALEGEADAYTKLYRIVNQQSQDISKRAVATHLLGKLKGKYDVRGPLFRALFAPDDSRPDRWHLNASVRMEACQALRDIPTPEVWEKMVDAYFYHPRNVLEELMGDGIAHLTDRLSGIEKEYSGMEISGRRYWFNDLAENREEAQNQLSRERTTGLPIFIMYEADAAPAHIHVRRKGKLAEVRLDPVELEQKNIFRDHEEKEIIHVVREHQDFLLKEWDRLHSSGNANVE